MSARLEAARGLVAAGLSVFPLHAPGGAQDGKRPALPSWAEYQQRLPTDAELAMWWGAGERNIAIVTGQISGIVVIDADSADAEAWLVAHLPTTPWRVRTGRGAHWYYRHPEAGRIANRVHLEVPGGTIDVRGDGGYVVGPGSVHASGAVYAPEGNWDAPRLALPVAPLHLLPQARQRAYSAPAAAPRDAPAQVMERARAYADRCDPSIQGSGGDNQAWLVACRIARGFDLDEHAALDVLQGWNTRCVPPWSEHDLRSKIRGALRYGEEPLGGRRDEPLPALPPTPVLLMGGVPVNSHHAGAALMHPDAPDAEKEPEPAAPSWLTPAATFLAQVDPPEQWLVRELLPAGVLCLVHGEPRARKSWFALELAVAMATGTPAFGLPRFSCDRTRVLYSSQEDAASRVRRRAQRFLAGRGVTHPDGLYFSVHAGIDLESTAWQQALIDGVRGAGIRCVILDPIRRYSPSVDKGPAEVRVVTQFLRRLSVEAACSVVIVHHDVKPGKEEDTRRRGHRASGGDWFAACEAPIHVEPAGADASLVVPEDYKFSDDPASFVFRVQGTAEDPKVRLVAEDASADQVADYALDERILAYVAEHPDRSTVDICRSMRVRKQSLLDRLEALSSAGRIDCRPGARGAKLWLIASQ